MPTVNIKRIYEAPAADDGARVLVDRLWPRGISKQRAALTAWEKDAAPSTPLRQWFGHQGERLEEFARRYRQELEGGEVQQQAVARLLACAKQGPLTLLYAAKDPKVNHALVLRAYLLEKM